MDIKMKIKLAILEYDNTYLKRIVSAFNIKYADKLEIYSFTNIDVAMKSLDSSKIDVFLSNEIFEINTKLIPSRCGFAYLTDLANIESVRNETAICKFQKAELIYKQVLSIFYDNTSAITRSFMDESGGNKVIAFLSPSGGTGSSTVAAACATSFAKKGKKVLYLNLERFGDSTIFFHAEGKGDFGDIIYAIKSKKGNLYLKLESIVKQDSSGVFFYSPTKMALDMAELNSGEICKLISDIKKFCDYDYIILDSDFWLEKSALKVLKECNNIVFVSDGSDISNTKLERAIASLSVLEQQNEMKLLIRSGILYNRFSSQTSHKIALQNSKEFGGIKRYEGYSPKQLLSQLSELNVFDALE